MLEEKKFQIIDLSTSEDRIDITNSEYILAIMEVCVNQKQYNIKKQKNLRTWSKIYQSNGLFGEQLQKRLF